MPKEKHLLENFLLSLTDWKKIFDFQKGKCAICKKLLIKPNTDHRHRDGLVRGILCIHCNRNLREFMTVEYIKAVLEYLTNPPATAALGHPHFGLPGRGSTKARRKLIQKLKKESSEKIIPNYASSDSTSNSS